MIYRVFILCIILFSCADEAEVLPTFDKAPYFLKMDFRSADSNYVYLRHYIDTVHYKFWNKNRTDSLIGSSDSILFTFNDSIFVQDTIINSFKFVDRNGIETFHLNRASDSLFINEKGEAIDFTPSLKRYPIKEHVLRNSSSVNSDDVDSLVYLYVYQKKSFIDSIQGYGVFVEDSISIQSSNNFQNSIFTGTYDLFVIGFDTNKAVILKDTLLNITLNKDDVRIDEITK